MRMVIAAVPGTITEKAIVADNLLVMTSSQQIYSINQSANKQNASKAQQSLSKAVKPFYDNQRPKVCRSHLYFGNEAKRCMHWYQWPNKHGITITTSTPQSRALSPTKQSGYNQKS